MKWWKMVLFRLQSYMKSPTISITLLVLPLVIVALIRVFLVSNSDVLSLPIGIVDLDQTAYSNLIIERVSKKQTVNISILTQEEAIKKVSTGKLEAAYILKNGLMDQVLEGNIEELIEIVKSPMSLSAEVIGELFASEVMRLSTNVDAAHAIVKEYGKEINMDQGALWQEAWEHTDAYWEPNPVITTQYQTIKETTTTDEPIGAWKQMRKNIVSTLILIAIMFSVLIACVPFMHDKNNGIIQRIIHSPTPIGIYIGSSIFAVIIIHVIELAIVALFTSTQFGLGEIVKQLSLLIMYIIWTGLLGTIIVVIAKTMQQLLFIIPTITLLTGSIGGGLLPFAEGNSLLQKLCQLSPVYWVLQGQHNFVQSMWILVVYAIFMFFCVVGVLHVSID